MNDQKYVVRHADSAIKSRRFHTYSDCASVKSDNDNGTQLEQLSDREVGLLGLKPCTICEKRQTGGPAVEILERFFGEDWPTMADHAEADPRELAWACLQYLKEHGAYISQRRAK